eukprot:604386_1
MGSCVIQRTDIDPDSDGEDETKVAYYADKSKKQSTPNIKRRGAHSKKRKFADKHVPIPSKRQRRNCNHGPPSPKPSYYPEQLTPTHPIVPPPQNGNALSTNRKQPTEHN